MSWALVLRHCAAVRATLEQNRVSLELLSAQLAGLEAYAKAMDAVEQRPTARVEQPPTCEGIDPVDCARLNDEAVITFGGMTGAGRGCRGCGQEVP